MRGSGIIEQERISRRLARGNDRKGHQSSELQMAVRTTGRLNAIEARQIPGSIAERGGLCEA